MNYPPPKSSGFLCRKGYAPKQEHYDYYVKWIGESDYENEAHFHGRICNEKRINK